MIWKLVDKVSLIIVNVRCKLEGGPMFSSTIRRYFKKKYNVTVGYGSYGGCFNPKNNLPSGCEFGNYCSIAPSIRIFRANHPYTKFTTHPILYNPVVGYVEKDKLERPKIKIGHDVWIGDWVIVTANVSSIGNGAIIGAGSVVTKDVSPYCIVAGNPAKVIKKRFDESTIEQLELSEWWNSGKEGLIDKMEHLNSICKIFPYSNE